MLPLCQVLSTCLKLFSKWKRQRSLPSWSLDIEMVDFIANLTGLKDAQKTSKSLLDVFMRVFLGHISIWISRLSKEDVPSPTWVGEAISNLLTSLTYPPLLALSSSNPKEQKEKGKFSFFLNWDFHLFLPSDILFPVPGPPGTPSFSGLQTHIELYYCLSWSFSLQRKDHKIS